MTSRFFADLRASQVASLCGPSSVAVLPVGAVEQHGPHLPLATDAIVAEEVSRAVAADRGDELDLWLLPTIAYGRSVEHTWAAGTVSLSTTTFAAVLDDIARSIVKAGIGRLAIVNGHGGNVSEIQTALRDMRLAHGLLTFGINTFLPEEHDATWAASERGFGIHGGAAETSLMLHLRPGLVELDSAGRRIPESMASNAHARFGGSVSFGWLSSDFGAEGYLGDPALASAEAGKTGFDVLVSTLGEQLAEVADFNFTKYS